MLNYYDPRSNYGLARDWDDNKMPSYAKYRKNILQSGMTGKDRREALDNYWGPGGKPAYRTPFGEQLSDLDPEATYRRYVGQRLGNPSNTSAFGNFAQGQYNDVYLAFRAALQRNPLLRFNDFLNRSNSLNPRAMENQYRMLTPTQRGENMGLYQGGGQRWV